MKRKIKKSIKWASISLAGISVIALVFRFISMKFLSPAEFGSVAIVLMCTTFSNILAEMGIRNYVVTRRKDDKTREVYSAIFWISMFAALTLVFFLSFVVSIWLANYYNDPSIGQLLVVASLSIVLSSVQIIPRALLQRAMLIDRIAWIDIRATFFGGLAGVSALIFGLAQWGLLIQLLLTTTVSTILLWSSLSWRPGIPRASAIVSDFGRHNAHVLIGQVLFYLRNNLNGFLVSIFLGPNAMGLYSNGFALSEGIRQKIASVGTQIMLPVYSKYQGNYQRLRFGYVVGMKLQSSILIPFAIFLFFLSDPLMRYFLDESWQGLGEVLRIVSLGALGYIFFGPAAELLNAVKRVDLVSKITLINFFFVAVPLAVFMVLTYGIIGAAYAFSLAFSVQRFLFFILMLREIDMTFKNYICATRGVMVFALIAACANYWASVEGIIASAACFLVTLTVCMGYGFATARRASSAKLLDPLSS